MTVYPGPWYVVIRKDNGFPLTVYADEQLAATVAKANGEEYITVVPVDKANPTDKSP